MEMVLALMKTLPAFPFPKVPAVMTPPLLRESEGAVIVILPPLPTPVDSTSLIAPLDLNGPFCPSKETNLLA